ncbi:hypothetical protein HNR72_006192 [Streptomyces collinus]|uniref:Proline dehydrogenase n=1 Tax=Streptomyces collinus TaxID=42684 RepID=A0AA89QPN3_STRCU|nr:hypothetical protein [Streptomyces collinus]
MNPLELARARPGPAFTVTFDGRPVEALPGQTVAAVLWAAGVTSWRDTRREGRPRGVFCGIGVCFDCLVTVNGRPNQRACLVPVRPGDQIGTQDGTGHGENRAQGGTGHGEMGAQGGTGHGEMGAQGGTGHGEMGAQGGTGHGEMGAQDGTGHGENRAQGGTGHGETGTQGGGTGHEEAGHAD